MLGVDDKFYIGIDPGLHTGVAVWSPKEKQFKAIKTLDWWTTADMIMTLSSVNTRIRFVVEDPAQNKPVFPRKGQSYAAMSKIAQDVGRNKGDAERLIQLIQRMEFAYTCVTPKTEKWGPQVFKRLTGWPSRTSEHGRDAGKLVWGY